jgi:Protein of unknown function (DUF3617)
MKLRNLALFAFAATLAVPTFAANLAKPGRWQTTVQMEMTGMPVKIPAHTAATCITKEQAENAENLIPKSGDKRGGCVYTDVKVDGNTFTWKMTCEKSGMTGNGKMTYSGDSFTGSMQMKMQDHDMSATYTGKFMGECDGTEMK